MAAIAPSGGVRSVVRPDAWLRGGGLLAIWLLLLIFIVYPLLMLLSRAFVDDGHLSLGGLFAAVTAPKNLRALLASGPHRWRNRGGNWAASYRSATRQLIFP